MGASANNCWRGNCDPFMWGGDLAEPSAGTTVQSTIGFDTGAEPLDQVGALSVEGVSKSAIARVQQIAWNTVDHWLEKVAVSSAEYGLVHHGAGRSPKRKFRLDTNGGRRVS